MSSEAKEEYRTIEVSIPVPWGHIAGQWHGNRSVRPILTMHGWLENSSTWNNLIPILPKHIGFLCIDLPGHGRSSKLPNGILSHQLYFLVTIMYVMREYNWNKVSILSHSMSSRISYAFASIFPQKIDLLISIDLVHSRYVKPPEYIDWYRYSLEKFLIENDRIFNEAQLSEPPSYTWSQMEQRLHKATANSVELANCHHILERNTQKSKLYPKKYYFSLDRRNRYSTEYPVDEDFHRKSAFRLSDIPYCVIKGFKSNFINENQTEVIEILSANNPHFEFHVVDGTHHIHLNNSAKEVAAIVGRFISRHRPPMLNSWTLEAEEPSISAEMKAKGRSKL